MPLMIQCDKCSKLVPSHQGMLIEARRVLGAHDYCEAGEHLLCADCYKAAITPNKQEEDEWTL